MATPLEQRVFEYVRGACAAGVEPTEVLIRQVIDLADGDPSVLQAAAGCCDRHGHKSKEAALLLDAALNEARSAGRAGPPRSKLVSAPNPRVVAALALVLTDEGIHVSAAEEQLLLAVDRDPQLLEAARNTALKEFARGLAAGDPRMITALEILEGAWGRVRGAGGGVA